MVVFTLNQLKKLSSDHIKMISRFYSTLLSAKTDLNLVSQSISRDMLHQLSAEDWEDFGESCMLLVTASLLKENISNSNFIFRYIILLLYTISNSDTTLCFGAYV